MREGDSSIVAIVDAELRALYPTFRPALGVLTLENPLEQTGAVGTEVQGFHSSGALSRIVASTWTPYGRYAVEYYAAPGKPIRFIFESAVYRDDAPGRPTGRNFWGQPSWERRYYFTDGRITFTETIGDGAAMAASAEVHERRLASLRAILTAAQATRR